MASLRCKSYQSRGLCRGLERLSDHSDYYDDISIRMHSRYNDFGRHLKKSSAFPRSLYSKSKFQPFTR